MMSLVARSARDHDYPSRSDYSSPPSSSADGDDLAGEIVAAILVISTVSVIAPAIYLGLPIIAIKVAAMFPGTTASALAAIITDIATGESPEKAAKKAGLRAITGIAIEGAIEETIKKMNDSRTG